MERMTIVGINAAWARRHGGAQAKVTGDGELARSGRSETANRKAQMARRGAELGFENA